MRTTLTLDDDLVTMLQAAAREQRRSFKEVVNAAIRKGISPARAAPPLELRVNTSRLKPGIDPDRMNQLADELEDEHWIGRMAR